MHSPSGRSPHVLAGYLGRVAEYGRLRLDERRALAVDARQRHQRLDPGQGSLAEFS